MAKVIEFPGNVGVSLKEANLDSELQREALKKLLDHVINLNANDILVLSIDDEGEMFINTNIGSERTLLWAVEKFKHVILNL